MQKNLKIKKQNQNDEMLWVKKVIESCETNEQLKNAYNLCDLWFNLYHNDKKLQELKECWFNRYDYINEM